MTDLQRALEQYIYDQENPLTNYHLALEYDKLNQGAAAISFYLRAAERTEDTALAYIYQIRIAQLFDKQGGRDRTVENILKNAIAFKPDRPEAYYIYSRFLEYRNDHVTAYMMANLGLNCDFSVPKNDLIEYRGEYGLIFQKAVSAWWVGKPTECRFLFRELAEKYRHELDTIHYESVKRNLYFLGSGPDSVSFKEYNKQNHSKLRHKFPGSENIERGYGQVMQDMFVLSALDGKRNGTYLEIGSAYPIRGNNTYLLEKDFGWTGVGVEYDEKYIDGYKAERSNPILFQDALTIDYTDLLSKLAVDGVVDYLQLDCDPPDVTYAIMEKIPFDKYKFAVITYEHDHYIDMSKTWRSKSREFLESKGYKLVVANVSPDDMTPFEDWWVHPELIDPALLKMLEKNDGNPTDVREYFFPEKITRPVTFEISKSNKPRVWVVDNFYKDPMAVRQFALNQEFIEGGFGRGFIGRRTANQYLFDGLKERFEQIIGRKITRWKEHGMNGRFQCSYAGEPLVYHADDQRWAGMLYLTPDAPPSCGTSTFAFKGTQIRHKDDPGFFEHFNPECTLDATPYEPVDVLGNVFNRLVIFDAGLIHSASDYFGYTMDNSRLWHMFFFD